jgi:hypothetical protein
VDPNSQNQSLPVIKTPGRAIDGKKVNRYKNGGDMMLPPLKNTCIFSPGNNYKENYESAKMFGRAEQNHEFEANKAEFNAPDKGGGGQGPAKKKKMPPLKIKKMHKPLLVRIFVVVMENRNGDAGLGRLRLLSVGLSTPRNLPRRGDRLT